MEKEWERLSFAFHVTSIERVEMDVLHTLGSLYARSLLIEVPHLDIYTDM